jgi:rfaE bifunctional protein nucleotidyltransferase chain/domain
MGTVVAQEQARKIRQEARRSGRQVVFTNGCFDVLHRGHVEYLAKARKMGDLLIVGLNSDRSVRALKGEGRPLMNEADRAAILAALACVDYVVVFDEVSVERLVAALLPDVLAKGDNYALDQVVGRRIVEATGGRVATISTSAPHSSSSEIIRKWREFSRSRG